MLDPWNHKSLENIIIYKLMAWTISFMKAYYNICRHINSTSHP